MVFTRTARNLWRRATARVVSQQFAKDEYGWVTITAANFQDVVIRNKRDVLIEFYTPLPSGQPDPLAPVLKGLVDEYEIDTDIKITFARCNVAEVDVPVEVYHLPTIKLYPAENKRAPVEYFGKEDDIEQYKNFIKEEGSKWDQLLDVLSKSGWKPGRRTPTRQGSGHGGKDPSAGEKETR